MYVDYAEDDQWPIYLRGKDEIPWIAVEVAASTLREWPV